MDVATSSGCAIRASADSLGDPALGELQGGPEQKRPRAARARAGGLPLSSRREVVRGESPPPGGLVRPSHGQVPSGGCRRLRTVSWGHGPPRCSRASGLSSPQNRLPQRHGSLERRCPTRHSSLRWRWASRHRGVRGRVCEDPAVHRDRQTPCLVSDHKCEQRRASRGDPATEGVKLRGLERSALERRAVATVERVSSGTERVGKGASRAGDGKGGLSHPSSRRVLHMCADGGKGPCSPRWVLGLGVASARTPSILGRSHQPHSQLGPRPPCGGSPASPPGARSLS